MAFQIRVSLDELRSASSEFRKEAESSQELAGNMRALVRKLDAAWDGAASNGMLDRIEELARCPKAIEDALGELAQMLEAIAHRFEAVDSGEATGPILMPMIGESVKFLIAMPAPDWTNILQIAGGTIRVIPQDLRQAAEILSRMSDESKENESHVQAIINRLSNTWEGNAYNRFVAAVEDLRPAFRVVSEALEDCANRIRFAADRYEEVDNMFG